MRALAIVLVACGSGYAQTSPNAPDAATMQAIAAKTAELKAVLKGLDYDRSDDESRSRWADVAVYLKAAEWVVKHNEWYTKDTAKQTLVTLYAGLARAKALKEGKTPWLEVRGKPSIRGYMSEIDGSVQPYSVTLPQDFGKDGKKYRLDIVLHGRAPSMTEASFMGSREQAKAGKANDFVVLEPYGRGNNAFRWAGERDVIEASRQFQRDQKDSLDAKRVVLRGFSMGGAGAWHLGLHRPFQFAAMSPGAGFTVTRGYIAKFPQQPDYIERCLHIYDAADYAENLVNIPCVAYSGELDKQRAAVDNIEARLKNFPEKLRYHHIIGTGLQHKQPPEWWAKVDAKICGELAQLQGEPERVRFVTYTTRFSQFEHGQITGLEQHYKKAKVDSQRKDGVQTMTTSNIREFTLYPLYPKPSYIKKVIIDGQKFDVNPDWFMPVLEKIDGQWKLNEFSSRSAKNVKSPGLQGPIDDAFQDAFQVVVPEAKPWFSSVTAATADNAQQFEKNWNKYFRGGLRKETAAEELAVYPDQSKVTVVLFGDPGSNPAIKHYLQDLPMEWTQDKLVVNSKSYDPKTHFPVMIYPHPCRHDGWGINPAYIVLNSGHTFGEDAFKGTNALLYPRLGDWAVMKLAPTKENPQATEVVDAGIFDENWQYEKKK